MLDKSSLDECVIPELKDKKKAEARPLQKKTEGACESVTRSQKKNLEGMSSTKWKPQLAEQIYKTTTFGIKTMVVWIDGSSLKNNGPSGSGVFFQFGATRRRFLAWQSLAKSSPANAEVNAVTVSAQQSDFQKKRRKPF